MKMIWAFPFSEPLAKQMSPYILCFAIFKPFAPNIDFLPSPRMREQGDLPSESFIIFG